MLQLEKASDIKRISKCHYWTENSALEFSIWIHLWWLWRPQQDSSNFHVCTCYSGKIRIKLHNKLLINAYIIRYEKTHKHSGRHIYFFVARYGKQRRNSPQWRVWRNDESIIGKPQRLLTLRGKDRLRQLFLIIRRIWPDDKMGMGGPGELGSCRRRRRIYDAHIWQFTKTRKETNLMKKRNGYNLKSTGGSAKKYIEFRTPPRNSFQLTADIHRRVS